LRPDGNDPEVQQQRNSAAERRAQGEHQVGAAEGVAGLACSPIGVLAAPFTTVVPLARKTLHARHAAGY